MATAMTGCAMTATQRMAADEASFASPSSAGRADGPRGDAARGREVIMGRDGNCLLCHAIAETGAQIMGNLGPPLTGVGARLSQAQLRLRIEDPQRFNPDSIMPAYARTEGLVQVGKSWRGKPILNARQIEDTVAFLATLR